MTAYTATFANGQTISLKNSNRVNTCAWLATITTQDGYTYSRTGWSSHPELADKAARAVGNTRQPKWWNRLPENRGKTFVPDIIAVEIVEVVAA